MRIEIATIDALNHALGLLRSQFDEHEIFVPLEELSSATGTLLSDPKRGAVLLAYDPAPVGLAVLAYTLTLEHGGPVAWLDELFVVPECRTRGTGLALLRRAIEVAKQAGCRAVDLEVDADHVRAEHLYERQGFRRLSRNRWVKRLETQ
jgi:GNAT superfamily N-acetyltransferase